MLMSADMGLLEPEMVMQYLAEDTQWFLAGRYGLGPPAQPQLHGWADSLIWVLAAELIARAPDRWWVIETILSGWMVDCITLKPRDHSGGLLISSEGIVYVHPAEGYESRFALDEIARDVDEIASWCEARLGVEGADVADRADWPLVMAKLAQRFDGIASWSSAAPPTDGDSSLTHPRFREIPAVLESLRHHDVTLEQGLAAHQVWFLTTPDGGVVAAIDLVNAVGWSAAGREFNLRQDADPFFTDIAAASGLPT
jgi:hypothetical protein